MRLKLIFYLFLSLVLITSVFADATDEAFADLVKSLDEQNTLIGQLEMEDKYLSGGGITELVSPQDQNLYPFFKSYILEHWSLSWFFMILINTISLILFIRLIYQYKDYRKI